MFQKAGEPSLPLRPQTFPAILTDAGKVSKVALGVEWVCWFHFAPFDPLRAFAWNATSSWRYCQLNSRRNRISYSDKV